MKNSNATIARGNKRHNDRGKGTITKGVLRIFRVAVSVRNDEDTRWPCGRPSPIGRTRISGKRAAYFRILNHGMPPAPIFFFFSVAALNGGSCRRSWLPIAARERYESRDNLRRSSL